ncbi:Arc family DNA-binding protein [Paracoccus sp. DMF]|uniref:Arc family DNA-binding protein n=1 Tax=Paracoccus sp. DMF TaxID=400837 RepID=UPI001103D0BA|nr:Arc family DNA-binding protein [Paracoccus sp. DMF]MCV2446668.1 Arc family DNA-binding protein [Paracoccus sp. DMF]
MSKPPAREQAQVNIRMPEDLRERIKSAADGNNRSMNAEIVVALEDRYPAPPTFYDTEKVHAIIAEMRELLAILQAPAIEADRKQRAQNKIDQLETEYQKLRALK